MTNFAFSSQVLRSYLLRNQEQGPRGLPPSFCSDLLLELTEEVRGYDFTKSPQHGEGISVGKFGRSHEEICEFVDWSVTIWNQVVRPDVRSRKLTAHDLITNRSLMGDAGSAWDTLEYMFECWRDFIEDDFGGEYIAIDRFPMPSSSEDPFATPGNLCAAFGLAVIDEGLCLWEKRELEQMLDYFGKAWKFASIARWLNHSDMGNHFNEKSHSQRMANAAAKRYSADPKQRAKREVKDCWHVWKSNPDSYPSIAAFARDMIAKWPDELTSEAVICRWVRAWERMG